MITDSIQAGKHKAKPPCHCAACLRATAQADQRRAELADILARLDRAEQLLEVASDE